LPPFLSFPLVGKPSDPPLWKRGARGDFMENGLLKNPPQSPFAKGGKGQKDCGQAAMTKKRAGHSI